MTPWLFCELDFNGDLGCVRASVVSQRFVPKKFSAWSDEAVKLQRKLVKTLTTDDNRALFTAEQ